VGLSIRRIDEKRRVFGTLRFDKVDSLFRQVAIDLAAIVQIVVPRDGYWLACNTRITTGSSILASA
jgi:hypothetical protein